MLVSASSQVTRTITRRSPQEETYPNQLSPDLGNRLIRREGNVGHVRRVADDAAVRVTVDVRLPLPAGRVRVARTDELGLEAL